VIGIIKDYIKKLDCIPTSDEHFKYSNEMISRDNAMIVDYRAFFIKFFICVTHVLSMFFNLLFISYAVI